MVDGRVQEASRGDVVGKREDEGERLSCTCSRGDVLLGGPGSSFQIPGHVSYGLSDKVGNVDPGP